MLHSLHQTTPLPGSSATSTACGSCQAVHIATTKQFARNVAGLDAAHAELDPAAEEPMIATLFQPQVGATRTHTLHPLIDAFLGAAQENSLRSVTPS